MQRIAGAVLFMAAAPLWAQAQVPAPIKARVNQLVAQCAAAGGTLGSMTGQGQFVIPKDFTGDGRTDFLISEGNFPCAGQPNLFRPDGSAKVELWVGDGAGGASLAFQDRLLGYRILAGPPARLQIARKGAACSPGGSASARCGDELRWNSPARRFDQIATDGRDATPRPVGAALSSPASAATVAPAGPAPTALALIPDAEARYKAKCRKDILAGNPQAAKWVDGECAEGWKRAQATGPAADAFLAALPATGSGPAAVAATKARMTGVRWGSTRPGALAVGKLGDLEMLLQGKGTPEAVAAGWWKKGALIPFDMPGALEARGAKLTLVSCEQIGVGEGTRIWSGTAPGRQPFTLTISSREAPTADADSSFGADMTLTGKTPPRGSLAACRDF
jgi:hypothetical protein